MEPHVWFVASLLRERSSLTAFAWHLRSSTINGSPIGQFSIDFSLILIGSRPRSANFRNREKNNRIVSSKFNGIRQRNSQTHIATDKDHRVDEWNHLTLVALELQYFLKRIRNAPTKIHLITRSPLENDRTTNESKMKQVAVAKWMDPKTHRPMDDLTRTKNAAIESWWIAEQTQTRMAFFCSSVCLSNIRYRSELSGGSIDSEHARLDLNNVSSAHMSHFQWNHNFFVEIRQKPSDGAEKIAGISTKTINIRISTIPN